jgi:hypothetical protein
MSRLELDPEVAHAALSRRAVLVGELSSAAARVHDTDLDASTVGRAWSAPAEHGEAGLAARRDALASGIGQAAADLALTVLELRRYLARMTGQDAAAALSARELEAELRTPLR